MNNDELLSGETHQFLDSLVEARKYRDSTVVLLGDNMGQIMATFPAAKVACDEVHLRRLLDDLGALAGWTEDSLSIFYVIAPPGTGIPGGMGGGLATGGIWVHEEFSNDYGFDLTKLIEDVISGGQRPLTELAIPRLIDVLRISLVDDGQSSRQRNNAMELLSWLSLAIPEYERILAPVIPLLIDAARQCDPSAVCALASLPWAADQSVPVLVDLLTDRTKCDCAERALSRLGECVKPWMPQLMQIANHESPSVRLSAARVLLGLGAPREPFVARVAKDLASGDAPTVTRALALSTSLGAAAREVLPLIEWYLAGSSRLHRRIAIEAQGAIWSALDPMLGSRTWFLTVKGHLRDREHIARRVAAVLGVDVSPTELARSPGVLKWGTCDELSPLQKRLADRGLESALIPAGELSASTAWRILEDE